MLVRRNSALPLVLSLSVALALSACARQTGESPSLPPRSRDLPPVYEYKLRFPRELKSQPDRYESDDTTSEATTLTLAAAPEWHTIRAGDEDWFVVNPMAAELSVETASLGAALDSEVSVWRGRLSGESGDAPAGPNERYRQGSPIRDFLGDRSPVYVRITSRHQATYFIGLFRSR